MSPGCPGMRAGWFCSLLCKQQLAWVRSGPMTLGQQGHVPKAVSEPGALFLVSAWKLTYIRVWTT